jgi:hypothetical protein
LRNTTALPAADFRSMGGQYAMKAGNRRFPGKIAENKLTAAGQTVTIEYVQKSPS